MAIWELEQDSAVYQKLTNLISRCHQHLAEAKIVLYACDKNKLNGEKVTIAEASKASSKMKASTNADFTITIYMGLWSTLTDTQKEACLDHELMHCGVHYVPVTEQIGTTRRGRAKTRIVKDEFGRTQYTNEIKRDENGVPKWRLITHDLEEFRDIVARHGVWDDSIQAFKDVLDIQQNREGSDVR